MGFTRTTTYLLGRERQRPYLTITQWILQMGLQVMKKLEFELDHQLYVKWLQIANKLFFHLLRIKLRLIGPCLFCRYLAINQSAEQNEILTWWWNGKVEGVHQSYDYSSWWRHGYLNQMSWQSIKCKPAGGARLKPWGHCGPSLGYIVWEQQILVPKFVPTSQVYSYYFTAQIKNVLSVRESLKAAGFIF